MDTHRPPHIYHDEATYFITSSTLNKIRYFNSDQKKDILLDVIHRACERFTKPLSAWTVLDNHYHILVEINRGRDIPQFVSNIHANSSRLLNKLENSRGRKIWYQYFDTCIRDEKDYWIRFNYVHHNCVKHKYTKTMPEYKYSSYNHFLNEKGREWMDGMFSKYPILDFSAEAEAE